MDCHPCAESADCSNSGAYRYLDLLKPISFLREYGITWIRQLPDSLIKEIQRRERDGN